MTAGSGSSEMAGNFGKVLVSFVVDEQDCALKLERVEQAYISFETQSSNASSVHVISPRTRPPSRAIHS